MSQVNAHQNEEPATVHAHDPGCLCCCHFAVDLESVAPEARTRRSRRPKHKRSAYHLCVS